MKKILFCCTILFLLSATSFCQKLFRFDQKSTKPGEVFVVNSNDNEVEIQIDGQSNVTLDVGVPQNLTVKINGQSHATLKGRGIGYLVVYTDGQSTLDMRNLPCQKINIAGSNGQSKDIFTTTMIEKVSCDGGCKFYFTGAPIRGRDIYLNGGCAIIENADPKGKYF